MAPATMGNVQRESDMETELQFQAMKAEFKEKLREVAKMLDGWILIQSVNGMELQGPFGLKIFCRYPERGRVEIFGGYTHCEPNHNNYSAYAFLRDGEKFPHITVSEKADAARIFREIQRRVVPQLTEIAGKVCDRMTADKRRHIEQNRTIAELAAIIGERPDVNGYSASWYKPEGHGRVTVSDETAEINLRSIPLATARKILETLAETMK